MDMAAVTGAYNGLKFGGEVFRLLLAGKVEIETQIKINPLSKAALYEAQDESWTIGDPHGV